MIAALLHLSVPPSVLASEGEAIQLTDIKIIRWLDCTFFGTINWVASPSLAMTDAKIAAQQFCNINFVTY